MLHLAIERDHLCIIKSILYTSEQQESLIPLRKCNSEGLNAVAVALMRGSHLVANTFCQMLRYDYAVVGDELDDSTDLEHCGVVWYGLRSPHAFVREWARLEVLNADFVCLLSFMKEERHSKATLSFYLKFIESLKCSSFVDSDGFHVHALTHEPYLDWDLDDNHASSETEIAIKLLFGSIKFGRLDIMLHLIESSLDCYHSLNYSYVKARFNGKVTETLCNYALKCGRSDVAEVLRVFCVFEDVDIDQNKEAKQSCYAFIDAFEKGLDITTLNSKLQQQRVALLDCSFEDAVSFYGSKEYFNEHPGEVTRIINDKLIDKGFEVASTIDWLVEQGFQDRKSVV